MRYIEMNYAEAHFLTQTMGAFDGVIAVPQSQLPDAEDPEYGDVSDFGNGPMLLAGGPMFRVRVLTFRDRLRGTNGSAPFAVTVPELWALDQVVHRFNLDSATLLDPAKTPLVSFAEKVWHNVVQAYAEPTVPHEASEDAADLQLLMEQYDIEHPIAKDVTE